MVQRSLFILLGLLATASQSREIVSATPAENVSITVYRDPQRGLDGAIDPDMPDGFAMVSETRTVVLPPGPSTVRFEGVAEGMVAVSAIVTGLPGGVIEKNRNADLLSPAALVDGSLGNRVTISRTNRATGAIVSESAIVRTRADGGLVLQTKQGFEAVRCSGLPEKLQFAKVPEGLSSQPVFSIDTNDKSGGTYQVTLTYLASGFDWQADYVARLKEGSGPMRRDLQLYAWLTLANGNAQNFPDAEVLAVAGKLNIESNFTELSDPPVASPLRLTCYPLGSTAAGSPDYMPVAPAAPMAEDALGEIVVTANRRSEMLQAAPVAIAVIASEEQLGDLKLYRIPERVTVASKSIKQVAFLDRPSVEGTLVHVAYCSPEVDRHEATPLSIVMRMKNERSDGLGVALPMGKVALFEPTPAGELLLGEPSIRDYAVGQDVELGLGASGQAFVSCRSAVADKDDQNPEDGQWHKLEATLTNANAHPIAVEVDLGEQASWKFRKLPGNVRTSNGHTILVLRVPEGASRKLRWLFSRASRVANGEQ